MKRITISLQDDLAAAWPKAVLELAGAWPDFPTLEQIRKIYNHKFT